MPVLTAVHRQLKFLWKIERAFQKHILNDVKAVSKIRRIFHPKVRKHWMGIGVGMFIAATGSTIALIGGNQHFIPHPLWDTGPT